MRITEGAQYRLHAVAKDRLIEFPHVCIGEFYNACTEPCDMLSGPCACGAWHHIRDWPEWLVVFVIGYWIDKSEVSMKEFAELQDDSMKLHALEAAGVDNWEGYDVAMENV